MELTGTTADRWEQVSNKIAELAQDIEKKKKTISDAITSLKQVEKKFGSLQLELEQLSSIAYKEVLREESGTLNDEMPVFEEATVVPTDQQTKKKNGKKAESPASEGIMPCPAEQASLLPDSED